MQAPVPILFAHYGEEWIRGSERCLLDLLKHLDRDRFQPRVWCNNETLRDEVNRLQLPVDIQPMPIVMGWNKPRYPLLGYAAQVHRAIKAIKRHNIQLLHANSAAPVQWLNPAARFTRLPLLAHLHARYPLRDRITLGLHHVSMAVGVSAPVIESLRQEGVSEKHSRVIANAIDTQLHDAAEPLPLRQQLGVKNNEFLAITVASLIHRKGIDLMLSALSKLQRQGIPIHLVVVGEGEERRALQQQILDLHLQHHVHLIGERQDVPSLLRGGADYFLSAAREEVFGLVLAEAGLARLPVIAPAVGGIPDVVVNKGTGLLFERENVDAMVKAIRQLQASSALRQQLGHQGREHVLQHFSIERYCRQFSQCYLQLLDDPRYAMNWRHHWSGRSAWLRAASMVAQTRS